MFRLHVINAKNLPVGDINGSSDPYVKCIAVKNGDSYMFAKTETLSHTLDPEWDKMRSKGFPIPIARPDSIRFDVFDSDSLKTDDFLARVVIDFNQIKIGEVLTFPLECEDPAKKDATITIQIIPNFQKLPMRDLKSFYRSIHIAIEFEPPPLPGSNQGIEIEFADGTGKLISKADANISYIHYQTNIVEHWDPIIHLIPKRFEHNAIAPIIRSRGYTGKLNIFFIALIPLADKKDTMSKGTDGTYYHYDKAEIKYQTIVFKKIQIPIAKPDGIYSAQCIIKKREGVPEIIDIPADEAPASDALAFGNKLVAPYL